MTTATHRKQTVQHIMTRDPIAVEPTTTTAELARILADNQISGVPVVDAQDRVVGVVSKTDLLLWCVSGGLAVDGENLLTVLTASTESEEIEKRRDDLGVVDDFMSVEPITTTAQASIESVAKMMVNERVHRVIVLDEDGCLTGIVTSLDLLKALTH